MAVSSITVPGFLFAVTLPLYIFGRLAFAALLLRAPAATPRRLFGLTFAASGALLLLVLLEVWGALVEAEARRVLWRLHLVVNLTLVLLLLPYVLLCLAHPKSSRILNDFFCKECHVFFSNFF